MNSISKSDLFEAFANASDKIYIYVSDMKTGITHWSRTAVYDFDLPD